MTLRLARLRFCLLALHSTMQSQSIRSLAELRFTNRALKKLPIDSITENYVRTVKNACFSRVKPTPLSNPTLVVHSDQALQLLDLSGDSIDEHTVQCLAGNEIIDGSEPASHCYCGYQFGTFAGQLGDGAAICLGEIVNNRGEHWELQLKGSGPTPYSRDSDGRKVLRSSIREFLCSEAMHSLGIGTTRAATCIVSDDQVVRDMFYDGNSKRENCTVVSRIAPSFIRFGSFEIFTTLNRSSGLAGPSVGRNDLLATLADFTIETLYPSITDGSKEEKYKQFYKEVVIRTAKLVASWQAVGFVHGVLNTDNMSILGLTIDYGPFGFLDRYDPDHIPNTSDTEGRYRFQQQPEICCWNLNKFAEALNPLVPMQELKSILNEHYFKEFKEEYESKMIRKLGFSKRISESDSEISDHSVISKLLETLQTVGGDYTNCFRSLSILSMPGLPDHEESSQKLKSTLLEQSSSREEMIDFYQNLTNSPMFVMNLILLQNFAQQLEDNPKFASILKNIENYKHLEESKPEQIREESERSWQLWLEVYLERLQFEIKDLKDAEQIKLADQKRKQLMNENNPRYVLRNHLAQEAISKAEKRDFTEVRRLLEALQDPYSNRPEFDDYTRKPPKSACKLRVSCSS